MQRNASRDEIDAAYGDPLRGISAHFAHEERQMRNAAYDQADAHKNDHERLLDAMSDIIDADATERSGAHLAQVLGDWFTGHFASHDARLPNKLGPHSHD